jgi:hypothetical protein
LSHARDRRISQRHLAFCSAVFLDLSRRRQPLSARTQNSLETALGAATDFLRAATGLAERQRSFPSLVREANFYRSCSPLTLGSL